MCHTNHTSYCGPFKSNKYTPFGILIPYRLNHVFYHHLETSSFILLHLSKKKCCKRFICQNKHNNISHSAFTFLHLFLILCVCNLLNSKFMLCILNSTRIVVKIQLNLSTTTPPLTCLSIKHNPANPLMSSPTFTVIGTVASLDYHRRSKSKRKKTMTCYTTGILRLNQQQRIHYSSKMSNKEKSKTIVNFCKCYKVLEFSNVGIESSNLYAV